MDLLSDNFASLADWSCIPPMVSDNIGTIACSAGSVTAGPQSFGPELNRVLVGIQQFIVAGNSASDYNGAVTNVHVNGDGSANWTAPGGTCTSASGTGGTISISHTQEFFEYCAAEVIAIDHAQFDGSGLFFSDGTVDLDAHHCKAQTGKNAVQPNRVEAVISMYGSQFIANTQSILGSNAFEQRDISGIGMSGEPVNTYTTSNDVDPVTGDYFGHGGIIQGSDIEDVEMPYNIGFFARYAPLNGNPFLFFGCPLEGCSATMPDVPIWQGGGYIQNGGITWKGSINHLNLFNLTEFQSGIKNLGGFEQTFNNQITLDTLSSAEKIGQCNPFSGDLSFCFGSVPNSGAAQDGTWHVGTLIADAGAILPASTTIGSKNPCLQDGTNCSRPITATNCSSAASPAVCGSAAAGSFVIAAGATATVIDTTAVTANSQIMVYPDESLGTKLGVTCNTTAATALATNGVTSRTAGVSFKVITSGTVATHPACYSYVIVN